MILFQKIKKNNNEISNNTYKKFNCNIQVIFKDNKFLRNLTQHETNN